MVNYEIKNLVQRSEEWHTHRSKTIGASDIAIIMGISPFMKRHKLWEIKTGRSDNIKTNFAMQRGVEAEPLIREFYETYTGVETRDLIVIDKNWQVASASLDAMVYDSDAETFEPIIAEFKYPKQEVIDMAKNGIVPPHYMAQVQWQLMITGAEYCDFVAYGNDDNYGIVKVMPDKKMHKEMLKEAKEFWSHVENDTAPEVAPNEHHIVDGEAFYNLETEALKLKTEIDLITARYDGLKKKMIDMADGKNIKGSFFTITSKTRMEYDWDKIKDEWGISKADLDLCKKEGINYMEVRKTSRKGV